MSGQSRWFRIEQDERAWMGLLCGGLFFLAATSAVLLGIVQSFIIKRLGIGYLPVFFLLNAVTGLFGAWLTLKPLRRFRAVTQSTALAIAAVVGGAVFAALQSRFGSGTGTVSLVAFAGLGTLIGTSGADVATAKLRVFAAEIFNSEQFSRLDFLLSSAVILGLCSGGLLLAGFGGFTAPTITFFSVPILLVVASVFCFALFNRSRRHGTRYQVESAASRVTAWASGWRQPDVSKEATFRGYLKLLAVIIGLSMVFGRLFQFAFAAVADARFQSEPALAGFIGIYMAALSVGSIIVFNSLHRAVLVRFGLTNSLFVPPAMVAAGTVGMFVSPVLPFIVGVVFIRDLFVPLQQTSFRAMLGNLNDWRRNLAWSWLDGPVTVIGDLSGSLLVLLISILTVGSTTAIVRSVAVAVMVLLVIRFALTVRLRARYPGLLLASLETGDFKTRLRAMESMAEFRFLQERRLGAVLEVLRNETEPAALRAAALRTLGAIRDASTLRIVSHFLTHDDARIREEAVRTAAAFQYHPDHLYESGFSRFMLIEEMHRAFARETEPDILNGMIEALVALRDPNIIPFLLSLLQHDSRNVRHSTLRCLRVFTDPSIIDHAKPFLLDPDPVLRAQAIASLWQFPWERNLLEVALARLLSAPDASVERRQGLYLVGALRLKDRRNAPLAALESSDAATRLVSAITLLKLGDASGMRILTAALREGTEAEAFEVRRLEHHRDVPTAQRERIGKLVHAFHLHYPADLPVSEPLRARLRDVPKTCLEFLRAFYVSPTDAGERRKIDEAIAASTVLPVKGKILLAGVSAPWREMAGICLSVHGWLVRFGNDPSEAEVGEVIVTEDEITKSHYAPSELLAAVEKKHRI